MTPTVTCLLLTHNRLRFLPQAIQYFLRQDYAACELVVVDDGTESAEALIPPDMRIRYIRLSKRHTVGAKRNIGCEAAQGDLIVHWDDDDWHAPGRLSAQVEHLMRSRADLGGIARPLFFQPASNRAWQYVYDDRSRPWVAGGTLCYTRELWLRNPFPAIDVGEDTHFVWSGCHRTLAVLPDPNVFIAILHLANVDPKRSTGRRWHPYPVQRIHTLLGDDLTFYRADPPLQTPSNGSA